MSATLSSCSAHSIVAGLAAILLAWMQPGAGETPPMDWRGLGEILVLLSSALAILFCSTIIVSWLVAR